MYAWGWTEGYDFPYDHAGSKEIQGLAQRKSITAICFNYLVLSSSLQSYEKIRAIVIIWFLGHCAYN